MVVNSHKISLITRLDERINAKLSNTPHFGHQNELSVKKVKPVFPL